MRRGGHTREQMATVVYSLSQFNLLEYRSTIKVLNICM
jgi:hypothetical protein